MTPETVIRRASRRLLLGLDEPVTRTRDVHVAPHLQFVADVEQSVDERRVTAADGDDALLPEPVGDRGCQRLVIDVAFRDVHDVGQVRAALGDLWERRRAGDEQSLGVVAVTAFAGLEPDEMVRGDGVVDGVVRALKSAARLNASSASASASSDRLIAPKTSTTPRVRPP